MNRQELLKLYEAGERDFQGEDPQGVDLEGAQLQGTDLDNASLKGANLAGALNLPLSFCYILVV